MKQMWINQNSQMAWQAGLIDDATYLRWLTGPGAAEAGGGGGGGYGGGGGSSSTSTSPGSSSNGSSSSWVPTYNNAVSTGFSGASNWVANHSASSGGNVTTTRSVSNNKAGASRK